MRVVLYAAPFSRDGPGLLYRDIVAGDDPQIAAALGHLARLAGDVVVLTDVDYDVDGLAVSALMAALARDGPEYAYHFAQLPNTGMVTGLDVDGDGRLGRARDAQGFGRFAGQGGMAVLSRWPLHLVADYSALIWRDLPFATLPVTGDRAPFPSDAVQAVLRLSTTGHWRIAVSHPQGVFDLLVWSATPPVFDGPEDANGLRNRDELRLWPYLWDMWQAEEGGLRPFVLAGNANLDPADGQGLTDAMATFLRDPRIQDPVPGQHGVPLMTVAGREAPAQATAYWPDVGALRVGYVLPSLQWHVIQAGVDVTTAIDPAGPHYPVWVDIAWP